MLASTIVINISKRGSLSSIMVVSRDVSISSFVALSSSAVVLSSTSVLSACSASVSKSSVSFVL